MLGVPGPPGAPSATIRPAGDPGAASRTMSPVLKIWTGRLPAHWTVTPAGMKTVVNWKTPPFEASAVRTAFAVGVNGPSLPFPPICAVPVEAGPAQPGDLVSRQVRGGPAERRVRRFRRRASSRWSGRLALAARGRGCCVRCAWGAVR